MKKLIVSRRIAIMTVMLTGGIMFASSTFEVKANMIADTHCCVTIQDTPTHKETTCTGVGTACSSVSTC